MVREVREENIPQIRKLILATLDGPGEDSPSAAKDYCNHLDEHLKEDSLWYYVLDDKEVAVLGVEKNNHISLCFTDPAYRERGAAKELFEAVKTILLARGFFEITADAVSSSEGFFRKLGFQAVANSQGGAHMVYRF